MNVDTKFGAVGGENGLLGQVYLWTTKFGSAISQHESDRIPLQACAKLAAGLWRRATQTWSAAGAISLITCFAVYAEAGPA